MKHASALFAFALMSSVSAQTVLPPNYPYNPDSDGDKFVAVSDVLMSVASFNNEFQAQSIMVDTLSLEEVIQLLLQQQIQNQQTLINQQAIINGLSNALASVEGFDACALQWACGCSFSYQGYDYETVQIGEQCWFAENLRSENYANGDAIPSNLSDSEWANTSSGAVAVYSEDASLLETYGRLYNWYAVDDARGLCPSGWHVPTDGEWTVLTDHLGGQFVAGGQMKTDYGWSYVSVGGSQLSIELTAGIYPGEISWSLNGVDYGAPYSGIIDLDPGIYTIAGVDSWGDGWNGATMTIMDLGSGTSYSLVVDAFEASVDVEVTEGVDGNGTNSSGFSGLPGGFRTNAGLFNDAGNSGIWWSSSPDGSSAWNRFLLHNYEGILLDVSNPRYGFSGRCVLDAE